VQRIYIRNVVRGRRKNRVTESRDYRKGTTRETSETQSRVENENKKGRLRIEKMKMREGRADLYKDEYKRVCGSGKCR
jgi:hypothetical protein